MRNVPKILNVLLIIALVGLMSGSLAALPRQESKPKETVAGKEGEAKSGEEKKEATKEGEAAPSAAQEESAPPEEKCEGILKCIEATRFARWIREDPSPFAFAGILLLHTIGMGLVVGINAGIDLRILGLARELPIAPLIKFFPVLWLGFAINTATGILLVYADISTKPLTVVFAVKMTFIALALINLKLIRKSVFSDPKIDSKPLPANAKLLALASLVCWIGAVTAGRLMAYLIQTR